VAVCVLCICEYVSSSGIVVHVYVGVCVRKCMSLCVRMGLYMHVRLYVRIRVCLCTFVDEK
jgi:hypothetical protein